MTDHSMRALDIYNTMKNEMIEAQIEIQELHIVDKSKSIVLRIGIFVDKQVARNEGLARAKSNL